MSNLVTSPERTHVVSALIDKRSELAGRIEHLQTELRQAVVDLDNIEATLRIFAPDVVIAGLAPRHVPQIVPPMKGEVSRIVLIALRDADRPLTISEVTEAFMKERNLAIDNPALFKTIYKRIGACIRHWRDRGYVRSMPGPGSTQMWQLVPAQLVANVPD